MGEGGRRWEKVGGRWGKVGWGEEWEEEDEMNNFLGTSH